MSQFQVLIFSILLVSLIFLAAFFACAETGLMAVNRYRLRHKARMKKRYAMILQKLLKRPDRLLAALLIGSTFANMLASSLATLIAFHYWGDEGAIIAAVVLTMIMLIFAEMAPKTLAAIYSDQVARWVADPIQLILKLLHPVIWLANSITNSVLKLFHIPTQYSLEPLSREELRTIVYETTGKISKQYQNMLLAILDLSKLTVDDVMIQSHEVVGIDIEQPLEIIIDKIYKSNQGWMPVYRDNMNQIIGVLYTRDILRALLTQQKIDKELLQQFIQEPYFVPEGTSLYKQLLYFQQSQGKIAFIVDEYGEIQGLLTLNDILEEIVGDFTSSVSLGKRIRRQEDNSFLVDGSMTLREFNRMTACELPLGGPRTINGLITEHLESLPRSGTAVLIADYPIEIMEVKNNRVSIAKVFPKLKRKE